MGGSHSAGRRGAAPSWVRTLLKADLEPTRLLLLLLLLLLSLLQPLFVLLSFWGGGRSCFFKNSC